MIIFQEFNINLFTTQIDIRLIAFCMRLLQTKVWPGENHNFSMMFINLNGLKSKYKLRKIQIGPLWLTTEPFISDCSQFLIIYFENRKLWKLISQNWRIVFELIRFFWWIHLQWIIHFIGMLRFWFPFPSINKT